MKRIILVDGNSLMYRAYFATAYTGNLMQNSKGMYTNAIFNFIKMMTHLLNQEYDGMLVAFDKSKKTFRHELCDTYKDGRSPMPNEFREQIPHLKKYLDLQGVKQYELLMYEADDIIGTMADIAVKEGYTVDIYSSDKDLLQLVNDKVTVHMNKKGMTELDSYTPSALIEKYGLNHKQMIDLKALMGDPSDNLKGIPGVGEKTAIKLLQEYQSLENILNNTDSIKGKLKEKVEAGKEDALLCQKMCTIKIDSPIEITLDDILNKSFNEDDLHDFFQEMEFKSLLKKQVNRKVVSVDFKVINNTNELSSLLIDNSHLLFETLSYNYHHENVIAIGLNNKLGNFVLNVELLKSDIFKQFLEDKNNNKKVYDLKKSIVLLNKYNIKLDGVIYDMRIATYLVDPNIKNDSFKVTCDYFEYSNIPYEEEVYNKGAKLSIPEVSVLNDYIAKKMVAISTLETPILKVIKDNEQEELMDNIEIPLSFVLADMEITGINIDIEELNKQSIDIKERINVIEQSIYKEADVEFNISSVKQLGEVLFEKLELPVVKKNKTGYSTDVSVLEELYDKHPIVPLIMKHRTLSKLHSTYLEGLKNQVYNNKIHTIFEQTLTTTGRLSSIEPNLQNIPVKTEEGRNIRKIFIPQENYKIIATDYSQIELRVLAHMARVESLIEAFNNNEDIHTKTAKEIFKKDEITSIERRRAKAVNFGIVYGISAFGLSEDLDIQIYEAKEYIDSYLDLYPEIKVFMEYVVSFAKEKGYVLTLLNRRRYINELRSPNYNQREFGKRTAMNAPIQGSAADIIKIAMIKVYHKLKENNLRCNMLVTVHDEIVLECHNDDVDSALNVINQAMSQAFKLSVKLLADTSVGNNWMETK